MPLHDPHPREEVHLRNIELRGFKRHDGLFDIEGRLTDRKTDAFQVVCGRNVAPLEPIHDIRVRLTVDLDMRVIAAEASSDATPYSLCTDAEKSVDALVGLDMRKGWSRAVRELAGGIRGCTHMQEVLLALGSAAFQTLVPFRRGQPEEDKPALLGTCLTFAVDSPVVAMRWPQHHRPSGGDQ